MAISERKYQKLFEEAQADAIRIRKERDSALGFLRVIGRLSTEMRIVELCKGAIAGKECPDTARLDAVERECADIELTCGGVWRVSSVDGEFEADSPRAAIDKMIAVNPSKEETGPNAT